MQKNRSGFGTFSGVFTPTIVTILGVIMYLRHGWLVGNAGLLGSWLIIATCITITASTALSLSSIATNTRLHAGGAYAIIRRSLGLETGGSIGIMLYLAQSLAIVMYIFGFREGWLAIFPSHPALLIDMLCFICVFAIARISTQTAFRLQYAIITITMLSILSVSWAPFESNQPIQLWGSFPTHGGGYRGYWMTFAIFFPGVTGILAGTNLSGELKNPRHSIPRGTLLAVLVSGIIYFWLAYVYASSVPPTELIENYHIMSELSAFPWLIKIAIIGATFCSALATLIGAPRILNALALSGIVTRPSFLTKTNEHGEPTNATMFTGLLVFVFIFLRDLNIIAPLITICFLTTYGVINLVVLIEQNLGLVSFRPTMRIPSFIPFIGASGAFLTTLIINPTITLLAILFIIFGYISLSHRLGEQQDDVRTNLFLALARWAAQKSMLRSSQEGKAWMPHPIVPLIKENNRASLDMAITLANPKGSIKLIRLDRQCPTAPIQEELATYDLFHRTTSISRSTPQEGMLVAIEMLHDDFLHPNILILSQEDQEFFEDPLALFLHAAQFKLGLIYHSHKKRSEDTADFINVWIRPQSPEWNLEMAQQEGNLDLALLLAIRISQSKKSIIRLVTTLKSEEEKLAAEEYLKGLIDLGRLPTRTLSTAFLGEFWNCLHQAPAADTHIFGLPTPAPHPFIERVEAECIGHCIFVQSSGKENLLA